MLLCRTFQPLVLVPCLCLSPPAQHTGTSRDRTWGQCPAGSKAPGLGTSQSLSCLLSLQTPASEGMYFWGDSAFASTPLL